MVMPLVLVVEEVVDVLLVTLFLATMVAMVVTHGSVLIVTTLSIRLHFLLRMLLLILLLGLCLFQNRSIIDC